MKAIMDLPLSRIRRDQRLQSRVEVDDAVAGEYAEYLQAGEILPPVVVFEDGTKHWLADGYHRFRAHELAGIKCLRCDVRQGTFRDALLFSLGANSKHGLSRSNRDKRKAVLTALGDPEWSRLPDNQIRLMCGVSQPFVSKIRALWNQGYNDYNSAPEEWENNTGNTDDFDPDLLPSDALALWHTLTPTQQRELQEIVEADQEMEDEADSPAASRGGNGCPAPPPRDDPRRLLRECERYLFIAQQMLERWTPPNSPTARSLRTMALERLAAVRADIHRLRQGLA